VLFFVSVCVSLLGGESVPNHDQEPGTLSPPGGP